MVSYADKPWLKNYDEGVPQTLEYPDIPAHGLLQQSAQRYPDKPACVASASLPVLGRQAKAITFKALNAYADALSAALVDMGLQKGDRVAIVLPNTVQFVIAFYAVLKAGGVVAATNPTLSLIHI